MSTPTPTPSDDEVRAYVSKLTAPAEAMASPELRRVLDAEAARVGSAHATLEALALAIVGDATGAAILRSAGANVAALEHSLTAFLALPSAAGTTVQRAVARARTLYRAHAHAVASGLETIAIGDVLAAIYREPTEYPHVLLLRQGVARVDVLSYISHGIAKAAAEDAPAPLPRARVVSGIRGLIGKRSRYYVVLHNDHFTTLPFVMEMLCALFEKTTIQADQIAQSVHTAGRAVVGDFDLESATGLVAEATRSARAEGFPLKLTLEAVAAR